MAYFGTLVLLPHQILPSICHPVLIISSDQTGLQKVTKQMDRDLIYLSSSSNICLLEYYIHILAVFN
jgi:hypothetical protein